MYPLDGIHYKKQMGRREVYVISMPRFSVKAGHGTWKNLYMPHLEVFLVNFGQNGAAMTNFPLYAPWL
ncbi:MAG: hypothetical protein PHS82_02395 [Lachnospiraceae bacterium]|nr:hypothetical protein [Lachnospiraceae bacterium]